MTTNYILKKQKVSVPPTRNTTFQTKRCSRARKTPIHETSRSTPIWSKQKKTATRLRETMICSARRPRSESHNLIGFLIQRCRTAANLTLINVTLWSLGVRRTSLKKKKNVCRQALAAEPDPSPVGFLLAACVTPGPHLAVVAAT